MSEVTSSTRRDPEAPAAGAPNGLSRPPKRPWRWPGLTYLSVRWMMERKARSVLTGIGIGLGVALLFATLIVSASSTSGLDRLIERASGNADVIVSPAGTLGLLAPGGSVVPGEVVSRVANVPGINASAELLGFMTVLETPDGEVTRFESNQQPAVGALGVDFEAIGAIYELDLLDGRSPSGGEELLVARRIGQDLGLVPGSEVVMATPTGDRRMTVVGVLGESGAGLLNRGNVVMLPIEEARRASGSEPTAVSIMLVGLEEGTDPREWAAIAEGALGSGVNAQPIADVWDLGRRQLTGLTGLYSTSAFLVVLIAGLLVYLTLSMAVVERVRFYGTLYALGSRRGQVRLLVMTEVLTLSAVSTGAGLLLGFGLAHALLPLTARLSGTLGAELTVPSGSLLVAGAFGLVVSLASALLPAHRAARVDPVDAMRGEHRERASQSRAWVVGLVAIVVAVSFILAGDALPNVLRVAVTTSLLLFGVLTLLPPLLRPLASLLGRLTSRLARGVGDVAVYHLSLERTRSAYTLGLVMVVVSLAVAVGIARSSFAQSMDRQLDRAYGADFIVRAASTFDDPFLRALEETPGVRSTSPRSGGATRLIHEGRDEAALVWAVDPDRHSAVMVLGSSRDEDEAVWHALASGGTVILGEATADRLGLRLGDEVLLRTVEGPQPFSVAGVAEIANAIPTLVIGSSDRHRFGLNQPSDVHVLVERDADVHEVRANVESNLGNRTTFLIETAADIKADVRAQLAAGINGMFVLILLAGIVSLAGLANTLSMSVLERHREIGILRSIGVRRGQLVRMTLVESSTLVAVAFVLGIPLGLLQSRRMVPIATEAIGDLTVSYTFPWLIVPVLAVAALLVAVAASVGPARRAGNIEIEEALRVE